MKTALLPILLIAFFLISCTNKINQDNYLNKSCSNSSKFVIDSPGDSAGYFGQQGQNDFLALKRIDKPSDTFVLRCTYLINSEQRVFEYTYCNSKASYKIIKYPYQGRGKILFDKDVTDVRELTTVNKSFNKNEEFISILEANKILELPDCEKIPVYADVEWQKSASIEYSNKCIYRLYGYFDPYKWRPYYKEAELFTNFLNYLKKEFDF